MKSHKYIRIREVKHYELTQEIINNPLMGFVPRADFPSAVVDNTLVYVDITMKEFEPEEGFFDFISVEKENHFKRWRKEGKHAVLRLINDYPSSVEHMDIPLWLYEKTGGDGTFYDNAYGKGYSPNYSNPVFIKYHERAVEALGNRYGNDTFISFIQLGSLGHWGEWHVNQFSGLPSIPHENIRNSYVYPYIEAFPNAKLLMRRPFKIARIENLGLYNDMIGHSTATGEWMEWISQGGQYEQTIETDALVSMLNFWKTAPVGGEFTSSIPMSQLLTIKLSQTVEMLMASHTSFVGPKIPQGNETDSICLKDGIQKVLQSIGYRIGISKSIWSESFTNSVKLKLTWENHGVAPMYWNWPVYLYIVDNEKKISKKIPIKLDLTELLPDKKIKTITNFKLKDKSKSIEAVYVGIEDPMINKPVLKLVSNQEKMRSLSLLKRWNV